MMIHNVAQGSAEWQALRLGVPTASEFHRVITPKTRKRSAQLEGYVMELVAEKMLGRPLIKTSTQWMETGLEREPQAVESYEFTHGVETKRVGFITLDDGSVGCSPDRIIVGGGLLECKCPRAETHIGYMMGDGPDEAYFCQLQGQLYVTGETRVDIISFYPGLPDIVVPVKRDEEFIELLKVNLSELLALVELRLEKLALKGYLPYVAPPVVNAFDAFLEGPMVP